ncbi:MAG TPA: ABC transporter permease [Vicinamibacterales bacterium]
METLAQDFRLAARRLVKSPAFAIVAILSLAIGIGTNTAAYSVLNAVLLRSLPVEDPASLAVVSARYTGRQYSMPHPAFLYLRDHTSSARVVAFRALPLNVAAGAATERLTGMLVSGNYFDVLGVKMALGTPIGDDDDRVPSIGGPRGVVAVLSHDYWVRQFNGDREAIDRSDVIGKSIKVHGRPVTIVGVAPRGFNGTRTGSIPDVYLPMMFAPAVFEIPNWLTNPRNNWIRLMARLNPGATMTSASTEMTTAFHQYNEQYVVPVSTTDAARARARSGVIALEGGRTGLFELGDTLRTSLFILMGLVSLVFLIACVNVANLFVGRAERHHRDTAIALALGASTGRLWSQNLAESVSIAAAGCVLGLLSAGWIRNLLLPLVPDAHELDVSMDPQVFAVSAIMGAGVAILLGAATVWRARRLGVLHALKGEDTAARLWLRKGLIAGQLALSIVVLVTAALFARTLDRLRVVDPGFERERVIMASMSAGSISRERRTSFVERMIEEVQHLPGVVAAAFSNHEPLAFTTYWTVALREVDGPPRRVDVRVEWITPDYFKTMGIPLLRGRALDSRDRQMSTGSAVVVNEAVARQLGASDPIGARFTGNGQMTFEVVGVVRDTSVDGLRETGIPVIYVPGGEGLLIVRTTADEAALATAIRTIAQRIEPDVPVFNVRTMRDQIGRFLDRERTFATLSIAFGALAVLLAAVGLYAVIANAVSRRTRELGIRLALGAAPQRIRRLVLGEAAGLVTIGIAAGVPAAYATGRLIASSLFEVSPGDPSSAAIAIAILVAVAAVSSWLPARRASRVDPIAALRSE